LNSWIEISSKGPTKAYPALLTNTSIVPRLITIFSIASLTGYPELHPALRIQGEIFHFVLNQ
jgi:hypothetical protein